MFHRYSVFAALLFSPLAGFAQEVLIDGPYTALFEISDQAYEAAPLRSHVEQEKKEKIDACKKDERRLKDELDSSREKLKDVQTSSARQNLHNHIAALEKVIEDKTRECEHRIPLQFEVQLSKTYLLERWPRRRAEILRLIDDGQARNRNHGDIEDIGYRKLSDDQAKDIPLGEQAMRQMNSSGFMPPEVHDTEIRQYVGGLALKLARNSDLKVPLHVSVVETPNINAMALPGGFIFLSSGLLRACETESQLAGIISQQIAQIAARHGARASKRSILPKIFVPVAQVATGLFTGGVSSAGAYYGMNYGFQGLGLLADRAFASSNIKFQKEADQLAIQYAWKAGFDPKGLISFLDAVAVSNEDAQPKNFLSAKRPLGERVLDAFSEIQYLPMTQNAVVNSEEFRKLRDRISP